MTSSSDHWEVASYVLGVLDDSDASRFEEHLAGCPMCADELESLIPVAGLLGQVDTAELGDVKRPRQDGAGLLGEMVNVVAYERSKTHARRLLTLAAGVVGFLVLVAMAFAVGSQSDNRDRSAVTAQPPATSASAGAPTGQPRASGDPGFGFGGPEGAAGERFETTDKTSGLHAYLLLQRRQWGTEISLSVGNITGPLLKCQLVAVDTDGASEVTASWQVPPDGYGTRAHSQPLLVQAATALSRTDVDRFEIRSIDPNGAVTTLATLNV